MSREDIIRLTSLAACAGWAGKAGPGTLAQVLRPLIEKFRPQDHPRLLVGVTDDAAVYQLDDDTAVVQTVDFFPPVVDDAWTYGAIAAANAMSDVYAMGGEVVLCLNIAGFPEDLPPEIISDVFRGGADKVAEAGGVIAGGHTVIDAEPKYGLSVMGIVHPKQVMSKQGALPGDALVLTKALGTGLILTAAKRDLADAAHLQAAVESMLRLNRHASHLAREAGAHAVTDVTGFAITGHALEIADHSGVRVVLRPGELPLLPGALQYAIDGVDFGGVNRNRAHLGPRIEGLDGVSQEMQRLLLDPQTSGGLLIALPRQNAAALVEALRAEGQPAAVVGEVREGVGLVLEGWATDQNYYDTFIEVAPDCPVQAAEVPVAKGGKRTVAVIHYELIAEHPYGLTQEDVLFETYAQRAGIATEDRQAERERFFSKGQPCLRSSPLGKRYGWGIHNDSRGRVALVPAGSDGYRRLAADPALKHLKAMRPKR